jgi:hypothetical protein
MRLCRTLSVTFPHNPGSRLNGSVQPQCIRHARRGTPRIFDSCEELRPKGFPLHKQLYFRQDLINFCLAWARAAS